MKKIYIVLLIILIVMMFPIKIFGLTEDQARKVIVDYANFTYNSKNGTISYVSPKYVEFDEITKAYYTSGKTFAMDCNAYVSFVVYNAFYANKSSDVFDSSGRVAKNALNGWASHSQYYDSQMYMLNKGESLYNAGNRYDIKSKLKPGDLIGVVGYADSSYQTYDSGKSCNADTNQASCHRFTHIMIYVGNGKYIHNGGSGVALTSLPTMSHGNRVGAYFDGGTHGSITIMRLKNYSSLPSSIVGKLRYPNGSGKYEYYKPDGSAYIEEILVTKVSIDKTSATIEEGSSVKLTATITPSNATNKTLTWSSSNSSVATVSSTGLVTGKKAGTTIITVTSSNGKKATSNITVNADKSVKSVSVTPSSRTINVGAQLTLIAIIDPSNATNKNVTWSSNNPSVVKVSEKGVITALKAGEARITVKTQDGGKTAVSIITVEGESSSQSVDIPPEPIESSYNVIDTIKIELVPSTSKIKVGEKVSLKTIITPNADEYKNIIWSSDSPKVANVDENGIVTGYSSGVAQITATIKNRTEKATATVAVFESSSSNESSISSSNESSYESTYEPPVEKNDNSKIILLISGVVLFLLVLFGAIYVINKNRKANEV